MTKIGESSFIDRAITFPQMTPKANNTDKPLSTIIPAYDKNSKYSGAGKVAGSEFDPQNPDLKFDGSEKIQIDNLKVDITDIDGIDTNSNHDLIAHLNGNVKFSRDYILSLQPQINLKMNNGIKDYLNGLGTTSLIGLAAVLTSFNPGLSTVALGAAFSNGKEAGINYLVDTLGLGVSIEKNPGANQYNLKLTAFNGALDLVKSDMDFVNGGIVVSNRLGDGLSYALFSPIGQYIANTVVSATISSQLGSNLGLKTVPVGINSFKLIPELNDKNPLSRLPLAKGSMNISLDEFKGEPNTRFNLDGVGNIIMDIDAVAYGSSDKNNPLAKPEDKADRLVASVDLAYRGDGSVDVKTNAAIAIDIRPDEKAGIKEQLAGLGVNAGVSGNIVVDDINASLSFYQDQSKNKYEATGRIVAKNLDLDFGDNNIKLSADGEVSFENTANGGYSIGLDNTAVTGSTSINKGQYSIGVDKLKAKGKMEYIPAFETDKKVIKNKKPVIEKVVTPAVYKISGANINANRFGFNFNAGNNWLLANSLAVSAGNVSVTPDKKQISIRGAAISANNLRYTDKEGKPSFNISGTFNGNAKTKSDKDDSIVEYGSDGFNISGSSNITELNYDKITGFNGHVKGNVSADGKGGFSIKGDSNIKQLNYGDLTNFGGKIDGSVDTDSSGNINFSGTVNDLKGTVSGHKIKNLDLTGKMSADKDNNLRIDAKTLNLDLDSSKISGSQLVIDKKASVLTITDNKTDDKNPKAKKDIPAVLSISEPKGTKGETKKVVTDLKFEGTVEYDTDNKTLKFNNTNDPLTISSGSILDAKFVNFKPQGEININDDNIVLKSPASFQGNVSYGALTITDAKFEDKDNKGNVTFNSKDKSINFSGQTSFKIVDTKNSTKPNPVTFNGDVSIKSEPGSDMVTITSKDGIINGKFGSVDLNNFKFTGQLVYNQKTGEVNLKKFDEQTPANFKGSLNGIDMDLSSDQGSIVISRDKDNYIVKTENADLHGKIAEIDVKTEDKGASGKITIAPDGTPTMENMDASMNVEGVKFQAKGGAARNGNSYEVNLTGLNLTSDKDKVINLLDKVKASPFVKNRPDAVTRLDDAKKMLTKLEVKSMEAQDLKMSFDKDFNYSIDGTATNVDLTISDISERRIDLKNTPPNKISFRFGSEGNNQISSDGSKFSGQMNGIQLQDFSLAGTVNFINDGKNSKADFTNNSELKSISMSGNISYDNNGIAVNRKVDLKADGNVTMTKTGSDLEFQSNNMKIDGMFSDFKIQSNPTTDNPPAYTSGKFTIKEDGHVDVSKLNFDLDVEGIKIANKGGSVISTQADTNDPGKREYTVKLQGNIESNVKKFTDFLAKIGNDVMTPEAAKSEIRDTIENLNKFLKNPEATDVNGKYEIEMVLNENFGIKTFNNTTAAIAKNVKLNVSDNDNEKILDLDQVEITAKSEIVKDSTDKNSLYVKGGQIKVPVTEQLKESVKNMAVQIAVEETKGAITADDLKDLKIDVTDKGDIMVGGTIKGLPIVNKMSLGAKVSVEGTNVKVQIDKAKLKGIFGFAQTLLSPAISVKDKITDAAVDNFSKNNKITTDYNGKNAFSFNLQEVVSNYLNDKIHLEKVEITGKQISVNYSSVYGDDTKYNTASINTVKGKFDNLASLNPKKDKKEVKVVLDDIIKDLNSPTLTPKETAMVFDRVGLKDQLLTNLKENDEKTLEIFKALLSKGSEKNNLEHIKRFVKLTYTEAPDGKVAIVNKPFKEALLDFNKYLNANAANITQQFKTPEELKAYQDFKNYFDQQIIKIKK